MPDLLIHVGTSRTATTVLQKHLFPSLERHLVFAKPAYRSSLKALPNSESKFDPQAITDYLSSLSPLTTTTQCTEFATAALFPASVLAAESAPIWHAWAHRRCLQRVVNVMVQRSRVMQQPVLVSSERLTETRESILGNSGGNKAQLSREFPVFPLCRAVRQSSHPGRPIVLIVLREPLAFLVSKYFRLVRMRAKKKKASLTPEQFIRNQALLEQKRPGTSALSLACHASLVSSLESVADTRPLGFKALLHSTDVAAALSLNGEKPRAFRDFPSENLANQNPGPVQDVSQIIQATLVQQKWWETVNDQKLFD